MVMLSMHTHAQQEGRGPSNVVRECVSEEWNGGRRKQERDEEGYSLNDRWTWREDKAGEV